MNNTTPETPIETTQSQAGQESGRKVTPENCTWGDIVDITLRCAVRVLFDREQSQHILSLLRALESGEVAWRICPPQACIYISRADFDTWRARVLAKAKETEGRKEMAKEAAAGE